MTAKDRVLAFVRSKNPQTMELKFGCAIDRGLTQGQEYIAGIFNDRVSIGIRGHDGWSYLPFEVPKNEFDSGKWRILGSDMGLQELLIAVRTLGMFLIDVHGSIGRYGMGELTKYDLTKNLHEQSDEFYASILPLLP